MIFYKDELSLNYFILACAIVISSGVSFWLYRDTDLIKFLDFVRESGDLLFYEQEEEELKFRKETIAEISEGKIDMIWLPVFKYEKEGYVKFQMYLRLLADNPDYEIIYSDIAELMDSAPAEFQINDKPRYLKELLSIEGVHYILLERYNLLNPEDKKQTLIEKSR